MSAAVDVDKPQTHDSICSESEFVDFSYRFGTPIPLSNGSVVKKLQVRPSCASRPNTLSEKFGTGGFPFHTDTAFWSRPARLVLLRAVGGDLRRPTILTPFTNIAEAVGLSRLRQGAWLCDTGSRKTFTTMCFEHQGQSGLRYDPNCMVPANSAARKVDEFLRPRCFSLVGDLIEWRPNRVAVIPNWTYLHARASSEHDDLDRVIERIYIY